MWMPARPCAWSAAGIDRSIRTGRPSTWCSPRAPRTRCASRRTRLSLTRASSATERADMDAGALDALMGFALDEAQLALDHDDVPIGAVVAPIDDLTTVLARAHNRRE